MASVGSSDEKKKKNEIALNFDDDLPYFDSKHEFLRQKFFLQDVTIDNFKNIIEGNKLIIRIIL